jgi:hypothetical protein
MSEQPKDDRITPEERLIEEALRFDALAAAEKVTGKTYKEDKETEHLGVAMHLAAVQGKKKILEMVDDTTFSHEAFDYIRIVKEEGFELILEDEFQGKEFADSLYVFWHPDGILLCFDTYWNHKSVNGGKFYYNWRPDSEVLEDRPWRFTSSGHYTYPGGALAKHDPQAWDRAKEKGEVFWSGDHDCREGLRHHLKMLRKHGTFLTPWIESPFLWLTHYADKDGLDEHDHDAYAKMADAKTLERFEKFPEQVKEQLQAIPAMIRERRR